MIRFDYKDGEYIAANGQSASSINGWGEVFSSIKLRKQGRADWYVSIDHPEWGCIIEEWGCAMHLIDALNTVNNIIAAFERGDKSMTEEATVKSWYV